jgi:para-aminobenzoate synthetase component I
MKKLSKEEAIKTMNELGSCRVPFLFVIDFLMQSPIVIPLNAINSNSILYDVEGISNYSSVPVPRHKIISKKFPISFERYTVAFENVKRNIHEGNSYLLNLTFPTRIEINKDLREIFFLCKAKYKLWMENKFVVFSPESFVKIQDCIISSFPMKGTIDASVKNARESILCNEKEIAEHTTIVDLIRNDLSIISSNVQVKLFRYTDEILTDEKKLLHVSSKITGELQSDYHSQIGTLLFKLLPAGSITGAPKKKTLEIILESEQYDRGYYTGVFGVFNGNNLDSGVMIRFIENVDGVQYYKSGGGITSLSDAKLEYQEMIDKVYVPIN